MPGLFCRDCAHAARLDCGFFVCSARESFRVKVPAWGFCHLAVPRPEGREAPCGGGCAGCRHFAAFAHRHPVFADLEYGGLCLWNRSRPFSVDAATRACNEYEPAGEGAPGDRKASREGGDDGR